LILPGDPLIEVMAVICKPLSAIMTAIVAYAREVAYRPNRAEPYSRAMSTATRKFAPRRRPPPPMTLARFANVPLSGGAAGREALSTIAGALMKRFAAHK